MTTESEPAQKRPYSRPTLITYGSMLTLTRTGTGSRPENKTSNSRNKRV